MHLRVVEVDKQMNKVEMLHTQIYTEVWSAELTTVLYEDDANSVCIHGGRYDVLYQHHGTQHIGSHLQASK